MCRFKVVVFVVAAVNGVDVVVFDVIGVGGVIGIVVVGVQLLLLGWC